MRYIISWAQHKLGDVSSIASQKTLHIDPDADKARPEEDAFPAKHLWNINIPKLHTQVKSKLIRNKNYTTR